MTLLIAIFAWILSPVTVTLSIVGALFRYAMSALPVWLFWTVFDFGSHLSGIVPSQFIGIGLFKVIGVMVAFGCLRAVLLPVPAHQIIQTANTKG